MHIPESRRTTQSPRRGTASRPDKIAYGDESHGLDGDEDGRDGDEDDGGVDDVCGDASNQESKYSCRPFLPMCSQ